MLFNPPTTPDRRRPARTGCQSSAEAATDASPAPPVFAVPIPNRWFFLGYSCSYRPVAPPLGYPKPCVLARSVPYKLPSLPEHPLPPPVPKPTFALPLFLPVLTLLPHNASVLHLPFPLCRWLPPALVFGFRLMRQPLINVWPLFSRRPSQSWVVSGFPSCPRSTLILTCLLRPPSLLTRRSSCYASCNASPRLPSNATLRNGVFGLVTAVSLSLTLPVRLQAHSLTGCIRVLAIRGLPWVPSVRLSGLVSRLACLIFWLLCTLLWPSLSCHRQIRLSVVKAFRCLCRSLSGWSGWSSTLQPLLQMSCFTVLS